MNYEISFLLNGKTETIIVKDTVTFYQEKLEDINIISVKKTEKTISPNIEAFLKPKTSIWNI